MSSGMTVPVGKELEIDNRVTLEIPSSQTATIVGDVTVVSGGALEFQDGSTATIAGDVTVASGGTLDFQNISGDVIDLTGEIKVESGATFKVKGTGTANESPVDYIGGGKLVLEQGSSAELDTTLMIGASGSGALFQWTGSGASIEFSKDTGVNIITLKGGEITVGGAVTQVQAAVIDTGATLIVDPTTSFKVVISLEVNGALTANKPIVGDTNSSTITFGSSSTLNGTYASGNFYQNDGTTPETTVQKNVIYTWNGSDKWLAP
jgi:hypothetical protein